MKSLFVRYEFIFNRKNILNSNGEALIQIRMYLNGLNRYFAEYSDEIERVILL